MFQPGISGNPRVRSKASGSGRAQSLAIFDCTPPPAPDQAPSAGEPFPKGTS